MTGAESTEFAAAASKLSDRFADRLPTDDATWVRSAAAGGEYQEMLGALLAGLERSRAAVTSVERDELAQLADTAGLPDEATRGLVVQD